MDDWEKLNETLLPEKEDFYSHLNMKHITDADYTHARRVCKDFRIEIFENILVCLFIHYYQVLYLKTFETCLAISIGVVDILTDIDM